MNTELDIGRDIPEPFKSAGRMPHFGLTVEYWCGCAAHSSTPPVTCMTHGAPIAKLYEGPIRPRPTYFVQHPDGSYSAVRESPGGVSANT